MTGMTAGPMLARLYSAAPLTPTAESNAAPAGGPT